MVEEIDKYLTISREDFLALDINDVVNNLTEFKNELLKGEQDEDNMEEKEAVRLNKGRYKLHKIYKNVKDLATKEELRDFYHINNDYIRARFGSSSFQGLKTTTFERATIEELQKDINTYNKIYGDLMVNNNINTIQKDGKQIYQAVLVYKHSFIKWDIVLQDYIDDIRLLYDFLKKQDELKMQWSMAQAMNEYKKKAAQEAPTYRPWWKFW